MTFSAGQRVLLFAGALLFLLGLLQGAVIQCFLNPRMALSAHLTAVQSGMAMMIVGAVWSSANLGPRFERTARWAITTGMYGLWLGLTASAATGASDSLPIAGAGHAADAAAEALVSSVVLGASGLVTIGWAIFVIGLVRAIR